MGHQVAGFSDGELVAVLREDEAVVRDRRAHQLALIAEAERRGVPTTAGSRSTTVWVRDLLNLADDEAKSLVTVARAVEDRSELSGMPLPPDLPATATALSDGTISVAHARVIVDGVATLPTSTSRNQRHEAETFLVAEARTLSPRQVRTLAERIRYHLDQDGALREELHHLATRELHFGVGRDGMTVLSGRLDRETGAKLRAALEPLAAPRPSDDGQRDPRSAGKRHADAFADLLDLALGVTGLPRTGGQRPHLSVSIDFAQLQHDISTDQLGAGGTITTTGQPLTAEHARRIACDAEILPIVLGGHSQPLDVGRTQRSAPPHLRAALHARDGRCAFPGCDQPPGTSEAHHIRHWADGGATSIDNMIMLCGHHHRTIHTQHWEITLPDGQPIFIPPAWINPRRTPQPGGTPPHHTPLAPTG